MDASTLDTSATDDARVDQRRGATLIAVAETQTSTIEAAFQEYTERKDIAILLINQHVSQVGPGLVAQRS